MRPDRRMRAARLAPSRRQGRTRRPPRSAFRVSRPRSRTRRRGRGARPGPARPSPSLRAPLRSQGPRVLRAEPELGREVQRDPLGASSSPATNIAAGCCRAWAVARFSKPIVLKALTRRAPGSSSARSSLVLRSGSGPRRFMASMTTRPSSGGSSAIVAGTAPQRSAKTTTSAPATASRGAAAEEPGAAEIAARLLSLSGSRTPKTTSWPALVRAAPRPPPTLPAPMIAMRMLALLSPGRATRPRAAMLRSVTRPGRACPASRRRTTRSRPMRPRGGTSARSPRAGGRRRPARPARSASPMSVHP